MRQEAVTKSWGLTQRRSEESGRRPIVVGIDGSTASLEALEWALRQGAARGAPVRVVTVWSWDAADGRSSGHDRDAARHAQERQEAAVAKVLGRLPEDLARQVRRAGMVTEVVHGDAASRLIERSCDADLLVLASHGARVVHEPLIGSVAEVCTRHAACPVVVVPAHPQPVLSGREPVVGSLP